MKIGQRILSRFWKITESLDNKRLALQTAPTGVTSVTDIRYINDGNPAHTLDVYYPDGASSALPVIVVIHGGGWTYGNKELNKYMGMRLAKEGFSVLNINYRLLPEARFPAQLQDIFSALNWLERRHLDYFADVNNVFLTGDSAGGHLAALTLALQGNKQLAEKWELHTELELRGGGLICGAFEFNSLLKRRNPVSKAYGEYFLGKNYKTSEWFPYLQFSAVYNGVLPPLFLSSSQKDFLRGQTHKMVKFLEERKHPYKLRFWDKNTKNKLTHVYQVIYPEYEESVITSKEMADFFKSLTV